MAPDPRLSLPGAVPRLPSPIWAALHLIHSPQLCYTECRRGGNQQIYFLGVSTANKSPCVNYGGRRGTRHDTAVINAAVISYAGVLEETNRCGWSVDVRYED